MPAAPTFLRITDVSKRYGDRVVLRDVDLEVAQGQTVALLGPSGGGKSSLLRCINGLQPFDGGEIRVGPHVLNAVSQGAGNGRAEQLRQVRRLVGMVFQDFQLFPHLSVLDNVTEAPRRVLGAVPAECERRARDLLARVGLAEFAAAWPERLSGGQKQRVAIARALAMQPQCLLCDEITSALDPELKHEVLEVLTDLRRDGLTILMVTHEIGFARKAADVVVLLADGVIVEQGSPEQVLDRPQHHRTRQFLERVMG
ncbi:MAG: amino acid ABC transporter ATP-binding protein [Pirellulales bacterium]